jgi:hypothetical protein
VREHHTTRGREERGGTRGNIRSALELRLELNSFVSEKRKARGFTLTFHLYWSFYVRNRGLRRIAQRDRSVN